MLQQHKVLLTKEVVEELVSSISSLDKNSDYTETVRELIRRSFLSLEKIHRESDCEKIEEKIKNLIEELVVEKREGMCLYKNPTNNYKCFVGRLLTEATLKEILDLGLNMGTIGALNVDLNFKEEYRWIEDYQDPIDLLRDLQVLHDSKVFWEKSPGNPLQKLTIVGTQRVNNLKYKYTGNKQYLSSGETHGIS